MRPHTVVTQVLLAVKAVRCGRVLLITGAALRLSQVVQQASWMRKAGGASPQAAVMMSILVLNLLFGAHYHIKQVAKKKVRRRQGVHTSFRDGHFLVTSGAAQLLRVPWTSLPLQALPAEGMEAGQDVQPPAGLRGGG